MKIELKITSDFNATTDVHDVNLDMENLGRIVESLKLNDLVPYAPEIPKKETSDLCQLK